MDGLRAAFLDNWIETDPDIFEDGIDRFPPQQQHGSSVVGLAIIGVWALVWLWKRDAATPVTRVLPGGARWAWWLSLPVVLVIAWLPGLAAFGPLDGDFTVAHLAYRVLPPACAAWGAATLLLCVGIQLVRARRVDPTPARRR